MYASIAVSTPQCWHVAQASSSVLRRRNQSPTSSRVQPDGLKNFRIEFSAVMRIRRFQLWRCSACLITDPNAFQVGGFLGSYGFMNVTSYSGLQGQGGLDFGYSSEDMGRLRTQDVGEGSVKIRLYEGRIAQGPLRGTSVIFKVYPGQKIGGAEADMMAANELSTHAFLQSSSKGICQNLVILLGGFETKTGEQWLAFRNDGRFSAADYAKTASEKLTKALKPTSEAFWNPFEREQTIKRRRYFVVKMLQGISSGLVFLHDHDTLHQSLGPASVVLKYVACGFCLIMLCTSLYHQSKISFQCETTYKLLFFNGSTMSEREAAYLVARLRDLAFSVDISFSTLEKAPATLSEGLWRRATAAGAFNPIDKRAFGIADDMYEAGLLFAYLAFAPFCETGVMDSLSLQRLLESTFQLDLHAVREYCLVDDRLLEAVKFLDLGDGAGWELLQAMLNPDFRKRPIAEAVRGHRFVTGAVL